MKHQPELHDDFISSAGVPTIPLQSSKKRSFTNIIVYAIIAFIMLAVIVIGYEVLYGVMQGFMALYFVASVVLSSLFAVLGIIIKNKWMFFAGILSATLSVGFLLSDISFGVSIAGAIVVAGFVYQWYASKYHYESSQWPLFVGVLALVLGVLLIIVQLQIIAAIIIAPVLLVITGAMLVWEIRRITRR
jgi:hypothetical protein